MFFCDEGHELSLVSEADMNPIKANGEIKNGKGKAFFVVCRNCGTIKPMPLNWSYDEEELTITQV